METMQAKALASVKNLDLPKGGQIESGSLEIVDDGRYRTTFVSGMPSISAISRVPEAPSAKASKTSL